MSKMIKQSVTFNATPHEVYEALMDSKKHSKFTGKKARISRKVGGKFTAYDGYIDGINLKLVEDKKIVQSWRGDEMDWPQDHFSTVTFEFKKVKQGTRLSFTHKDVPDKKRDSINQGWKDYYWTPLKEFLEQ